MYTDGCSLYIDAAFNLCKLSERTYTYMYIHIYVYEYVYTYTDVCSVCTDTEMCL